MEHKNWYAGDIHQHSIYSSAMYGGTDNAPDTLAQIRDFMLSKGLCYGAVSDHHNILNHKEWINLEEKGFIPIISKEISTTCGHVMALNCSCDVVFNTSIQNEGHLRSEFQRITNEIRENGGIAQLNHPRDKKLALFFPEMFTDIINIFDTIEIWNGSESMEKGTKNDAALQFWFSLLRKGISLPATAGSDIHRIEEYMPERHIKTIVFSNEFNRGNILNAIKKGNSYISSNPVVEICVNEKCFGETAWHTGVATIALNLESSFEIDKLFVHSNKWIKEIDINSKNYKNEFTIKICDEKWLVFEVGSDTYNKAITNPIFLKAI